MATAAPSELPVAVRGPPSAGVAVLLLSYATHHRLGVAMPLATRYLLCSLNAVTSVTFFLFLFFLDGLCSSFAVKWTDSDFRFRVTFFFSFFGSAAALSLWLRQPLSHFSFIHKFYSAASSAVLPMLIAVLQFYSSLLFFFCCHFANTPSGITITIAAVHLSFAFSSEYTPCYQMLFAVRVLMSESKYCNFTNFRCVNYFGIERSRSVRCHLNFGVRGCCCDYSTYFSHLVVFSFFNFGKTNDHRKNRNKTTPKICKITVCGHLSQMERFLSHLNSAS